MNLIRLKIKIEWVWVRGILCKIGSIDWFDRLKNKQNGKSSLLIKQLVKKNVKNACVYF
ncbi:hypothetical protein TYM08_P2392 [Marinicellulosiphila megalodicopiae]